MSLSIFTSHVLTSNNIKDHILEIRKLKDLSSANELVNFYESQLCILQNLHYSLTKRFVK